MVDIEERGRTSHEDAPPAGLARDMSTFARELEAESDPDAMLQRIVDTAIAEIDGASHAGISLIGRKHVVTPAKTSELVADIDRLQYDIGDGPCLTSLRQQRTVRADNLDEETRWPQFARASVEHGICSMLSVQLFVSDDNLGALNLYAHDTDAFTDDDEQIALLLAAHAAVAMINARRLGNLTAALDRRDVIGQGKGILMERFKISDQAAFEVLIAVSQHVHRKLHDVARELTETGELPDLPPRRSQP